MPLTSLRESDCRLINDRELQLHDGQRLLRHDRYDYLASMHGEEYLKKAGVHRIHPSFRIIALAERPGTVLGFSYFFYDVEHD